ncbi:ABC transporter substrate-binding protein [Neobacillus niacini]|uniref:ABC transporter substrate-binding protein n=1 Tax=Neobacillus niacini TaxID=86668 RepID=UPI002FFE1A51
MKKVSVLAITITLLLLLLTACGGGNSITDSSKGGDKKDASGKESVNIWYYYSGKQQELFDDLIKQYNDSQDQYTIKGEYVPFADTKKQLSIGVAGGTLPDLVIMDVVDNSAFAAQGVLADITDKVEEWGKADTLYEGPLKSATYQDKIYGLPVGSNALGLFYNEELLKAAGIQAPPTTWDELVQVAQKLTKDGVKGFAVSAVKTEEAAFQFYPFLRSAGADYDSLDSKGAIEALKLYKTLIDNGSMGSEVVNATQDDLARQFANGQLAMMVNGPWNIERIKGENPDLNFGISQIPMAADGQFASVLGGENIAIIKDKNIDGAFDFVAWLLEPKRVETFSAETGVFPVIKEVLETSDFWNNDKHLSGFVPIMDGADPRGPHPEWPAISEAIQIAVQETLTNTKSAEEALKKAAETVEGIINE